MTDIVSSGTSGVAKGPQLGRRSPSRAHAQVKRMTGSRLMVCSMCIFLTVASQYLTEVTHTAAVM